MIKVIGVLFLYALAVLASIGVPLVLVYIVIHFAFKFW